MPYDPQGDVAKVMGLYNQEIKLRPELPDSKTLLLRARLVYEEAMEFVVKGCGCHIVEGKVQTNPDGKPDLVEYADACGDTLVVTYGALNAAGIRSGPIMDEIQRSNMTKVWPDGTIHKREDGKVVKPPTYSPADIKSVLNRLTAMSSVELLTDIYPELKKIVIKEKADLWSLVAVEAFGPAFGFTYDVVQRAKDIGALGEYRRPLLARLAAKTIVYYYPSPLSAKKLARSLETTEAVAEELLDLFQARFPNVTPPRPASAPMLVAA